MWLAMLAPAVALALMLGALAIDSGRPRAP